MQDIDGSIKIGMEHNSTCLTNEGRAFPLPSIAIPANRTCFGGIFGSDEFYGNTTLSSLIRKKLLQLIESPVGEKPVLFSSVSGFPNALEFLQNNYSVFSYTVHQLPAEAVVHIPHKPLLFAPHFGQMPLRGTSAFALQFTSQPDIFLFDGKNMIAIVNPAIGSCYKITDASIYSKNLSFFIGKYSWLLHRNHKTEFSIPASDKIAFFGIPIKIFFEIFRDGKPKLDPAILSQKAGNSPVQIDCAASFVIMDRRSREFWLLSSFVQGSLDRSAGIFVGNNRKLGRKTEFLTKNRIVDVMHSEGVGFFMPITGRNYKVLGFGHAEQSIIKIGSLLRSFINKRLDSFHYILVLSLQKFKKNCETP